MTRYDFEPSAVGHHIAKVGDEPTRTALAIVAAMAYQAQEPSCGVIDVASFMTTCNVNAGNVSLPTKM
jgi:hypothetical protein